jgi:signal transduction histidine kinase
VRLTAAFAAATLVVLAGAAIFVYLQLRGDLDETVDQGLRERASAVTALLRRDDPDPSRPGAPEEAGEGFAQVVSREGRLLDASGGARQPVLSPSELARASEDRLWLERDVSGVEGGTRILARPAAVPGDPVVVVGQSLDDRDEALSSLIAAFAIGGPVAVLLASLVGYLLARAGLRPVEAMRRRAAEVSLGREEESLPLPTARDEVRRLGETLNEMLARLRRSFERERRFVADASHELRTPVAVVKTELETALRTGDYGPEVREALVAAVEECDHLAQLAEDMLVIARAADGQLPVRRERLRAVSALDDVRNRFVDRAERDGRSIRVDAPDDVILDADPLRLRQALGNLVDNALRHGDGDVVLKALRSPGGAELLVTDHGEGFADGLAARAFERFTRGDEARGRTGTGLGLAIVKAVAEAHGGIAEVVPDSGATVRIRLPGAGRPEAPGPLPAEASGEPVASQGPLS